MQTSYLLTDMTEFQNYRIRSIYHTCPNKRIPISLKKKACARAHTARSTSECLTLVLSLDAIVDVLIVILHWS